jgi:hypothetical protein
MWKTKDSSMIKEQKEELGNMNSIINRNKSKNCLEEIIHMSDSNIINTNIYSNSNSNSEYININ